nr:adenylate kinase [uncultured Cohaesibacter sp.]
MKRVMIIGCTGAGKSTLAVELAHLTGLPLIHLDQHFWLPNWQARTQEDYARKQEELTRQERWIMDGNNRSTMPIRLARADTVLFLDTPRMLCLKRTLLRSVRYWHSSRADMAEGCKEHINWGLLKYIWQFPTRYRPSLLKMLANYNGTIRILKSPEDIRAFLASLNHT